MSIKLMSAVWGMENLPPTAKLVLLSLCDFANDQGESCFPSIFPIAEKASLSERQTQRLLHKLINTGVISVLRNAKGGKPGTTRHYKIHINRLMTGDILTPVIGQTGDIGVGRRVTNLTETGDMGVTLTIKEPSIKPPRQQNEICRTEELPSKWQDFAEAKGVPEEQIFKSWRRFKDQTVQPYQLKNWLGWLGRERVKA